MNRFNKYILHVAAVCCAVSRFFHKFSGKKNILIVADEGLGDLILRLPALQEMRRHFPPEKYSITLWISPGLIPLASVADVADRFLKIPKWRNRWQWVFVRLSFWLTHAWDMIYDMTIFLPETYPQHDILPPYERAFFLTITTSVSHPFESHLKSRFKHVIDVSHVTTFERNSAILSFLEISAQLQKIDFRRFCRPMPGMPPAGSYFIVCAGAGDPRRRWEKEKFIELIDRLRDHFGLSVVLIGRPGEQDFCEEIRNKCGNREKILDLAGKTSIFQLFTVIRDAAFLISNDTGSCHVGAALGVQTFIICGQGEYGAFVPYPEGVEGITVHSIFSAARVCKPCFWRNEECRKHKVYPCISDITVDEVFRRVVSCMPKAKIDFRNAVSGKRRAVQG